MSKEERTLLFRFAERQSTRPEWMSPEKFSYAALQLQEKGLVTLDMVLLDIRSTSLTRKGKAYLAVNPKLRNPFPWDVIMKAATLIAAVAATAALFIGCCRLLMMR